MAAAGVGLLWFGAVLAGAGLMGDCATPPSADCEAYRHATMTHARIISAVVLGNTALATLAVLAGRRVVPGLLLAASIVTLALCRASLAVPRDPGSLLPVLMVGFAPGAALLAVGCAWQLARCRVPPGI